MEGYGTVSSTCLKLLGSNGRGLLSWRPDSGSSPCPASCFIFYISFTLLRLVLLWLLISALLRNYRRARAELYRPAVDLQDYEMVELFLRRLKMWMGLSRAKEVCVLYFHNTPDSQCLLSNASNIACQELGLIACIWYIYELCIGLWNHK